MISAVTKKHVKCIKRMSKCLITSVLEDLMTLYPYLNLIPGMRVEFAQEWKLRVMP